MEKKTVTIRLSESAHEKIKRLAEQDGRTVSTQIEQLIKAA